MILRRATAQDVPSLVRVINSAYLVEQFFIRGDRTSADEVAALIAAPSAAFLLLEDPDTSGIAGAVYVTVTGATGHFGFLAVDPACQGRGLGRRLIAGVEEYCRAAECDVVELEVFDARKELPPFYASLGYRPVEVVTFSKPELLIQPSQLIRMTKRLA